MAMEFKDILLNDDGDIDVKDGDFNVGPSDEQHIMLIMNTYPGNWKEHPTCGVGIRDYILSAGKAVELKRSINVQLDADGYKSVKVLLQSNPNGHFDYNISAERP